MFLALRPLSLLPPRKRQPVLRFHLPPLQSPRRRFPAGRQPPPLLRLPRHRRHPYQSPQSALLRCFPALPLNFRRLHPQSLQPLYRVRLQRGLQPLRAAEWFPAARGRHGGEGLPTGRAYPDARRACQKPHSLPSYNRSRAACHRSRKRPGLRAGQAGFHAVPDKQPRAGSAVPSDRVSAGSA